MQHENGHPSPSQHLEDFDGLLRFLAETTDLSPNQARELIRKHGEDREQLLRIAQTMKAEG